MRVSNPCLKDGLETGRQSAGKKEGGRFGRGFGGLLAVVLIAAAVSGCGGDDKSDKSDKADSTASTPAAPASPSAETSPETGPAATHQAEPSTLLTLSGSGTKNASAFKAGDEWTLSYTFDCTKAMAAVGGKGNFIVFDKEDKLVNELDKSGKGSTQQHTAGTHQLQIISECEWTVKVTG
ncbi:hypothetical protein ACFZB5_26430 [Streptomyces nodosus]|uniref:hypothetical protein n=1 Tax=Streptomyces nodosus TaxID=40318 RepID=UPI0036E0B961